MKFHRSLIRVEQINKDDLRVIIPSWSPDHVITIPHHCIDSSILNNIDDGTYLLGDVNIGGKTEDDLYFQNVNEIVPVPEDDL